jgi:hypothetical protein
MICSPSREDAGSPDVSTVVPLAQFSEPVWRDFSDVIPDLREISSVCIVLLDDDVSSEVARAVPDTDSWRDLTTKGDSQVLLLVGGSTTALDAPLDDVPGLQVEIASRLQDFVMDMLNTPWPVVSPDGGDAVVVEPALIGGRATWASHGKVLIDFGRLADALRG